MAIGQELLNVPFPDMVKNMGLSIAQSQFELDLVSIRLAQMMGGKMPNPSFDSTKPQSDSNKAEIDTTVDFAGEKLSLLQLGFTPTFYQFVDTIIEIKISISMKSETDTSNSSTNFSAGVQGVFLGFYNSTSVQASAVSASYASKYQYSAEGSSLLRTKLVPVPPPAILQERIKKILDAPAKS